MYKNPFDQIIRIEFKLHCIQRQSKWELLWLWSWTHGKGTWRMEVPGYGSANFGRWSGGNCSSPCTLGVMQPVNGLFWWRQRKGTGSFSSRDKSHAEVSLQCWEGVLLPSKWSQTSQSSNWQEQGTTQEGQEQGQRLHTAHLPGNAAPCKPPCALMLPSENTQPFHMAFSSNSSLHLSKIFKG